MVSVNTQQNFAKIEKMVARIRDQFHPVRIILFGSYARGTASPDSDVDLLVVIPVEGSKRKAAVQMDVALADRDIPLDLIVVTPQDFEKYRDAIGSVIYPAVREGMLMYENA